MPEAKIAALKAEQEKAVLDLAIALEARAHRFRVAVVTLLVIELITITIVGLSFAITRKGLCTFTGDLETRIANTQAILDQPENQGKVVVNAYGLHIRRAVLENQIMGQKQTLKSLDGLHC